MITTEVYDSRKQEINNFIQLMKFLEKKQCEKNDDGNTSLEIFFHFSTDDMNFSYQDVINIFKSNFSLMLYNIIEYTVKSLLDTIYDEIKQNELSYTDVNHSIKKVWRKIILKSVNDPNSSFNTFVKKNDQIIDHILEKNTLELNSRESLPAGNLDGETIRDAFKDHGIKINNNSIFYRPDIFKNIKDKRNNLAHGTVSFIDALKDYTISDIENNTKIVLGFLDELNNHLITYLNNKEYRSEVQPQS